MEQTRWVVPDRFGRLIALELAIVHAPGGYSVRLTISGGSSGLPYETARDICDIFGRDLWQAWFLAEIRGQSRGAQQCRLN